MVDPEILDPEPGGRAGDAGAGQEPPLSTTAGVERLVALVQKALPGRTVRVDVEAVDPGRPRSPLAGGPRFRIEAEGEGGPLVVESGPLMMITVFFRRARFPYNAMAGGAAVADAVAAQVGAVAREELVVLEEQTSAHLMRTTVLRVKDGRFVEIVDSGLEPHEGTPSPARLHSFDGAFDRPPTKQERARVDKLGGGLMGKLKRKLAEKVFTAAAGQLKKSLQTVADEVARDAGVTPDDGRRRLE